MIRELTRRERVFLDHIEYFNSTIIDAKTKQHGMYSHTINQNLNNLIYHMDKYVPYDTESQQFGIKSSDGTIKYYPLHGTNNWSYKDLTWFKFMNYCSMEIQSKFYMLEKIDVYRKNNW